MSDDRFEREREFFDASSASQFEGEPPTPTHHVRALVDLLGSVTERRILDAGCGAGELALPIAAAGGRVTAFDLSFESVRLMHKWAERDAVARPDGLVSVMERLPFPDGTFDAVVGKSILHHVDVEAAMHEIRRVLAAGGRAIFVENQVTNPVLRFARERLTGRFGVARLGTIDEHPLTAADYRAVRALFPQMRLSYPDFRFFSLVSRNVLRYRRLPRLARFLQRLDDLVFRALPFARRWGYHVILEVRKTGR